MIQRHPTALAAAATVASQVGVAEGRGPKAVIVLAVMAPPVLLAAWEEAESAPEQVAATLVVAVQVVAVQAVQRLEALAA